MLDTGLIPAQGRNPDRGRKSSLRADLVARGQRDLARTGGQMPFNRDQQRRFRARGGGTTSGPACPRAVPANQPEAHPAEHPPRPTTIATPGADGALDRRVGRPGRIAPAGSIRCPRLRPPSMFVDQEGAVKASGWYPRPRASGPSGSRRSGPAARPAPPRPVQDRLGARSMPPATRRIPPCGDHPPAPDAGLSHSRSAVRVTAAATTTMISSGSETRPGWPGTPAEDRRGLSGDDEAEEDRGLPRTTSRRDEQQGDRAR